jgi:hypothetical protein
VKQHTTTNLPASDTRAKLRTAMNEYAARRRRAIEGTELAVREAMDKLHRARLRDQGAR